LLKKQRQLGKLTAVRIGHDNKGLGARCGICRWHVSLQSIICCVLVSAEYLCCA
jgi:hypothetical protein